MPRSNASRTRGCMDSRRSPAPTRGPCARLISLSRTPFASCRRIRSWARSASTRRCGTWAFMSVAPPVGAFWRRTAPSTASASRPRKRRSPRSIPTKRTTATRSGASMYATIEHHRIPGITGSFYIISILDNFSRAVLASDIFQRQDLTAYLLILYAAIQQHGSPEMLVSDSGSIFKAKQAQVIYDALGIKKEQIHHKQAWENLIETQFNLQRRLADYHFAP